MKTSLNREEFESMLGFKLFDFQWAWVLHFNQSSKENDNGK